MELQSKTRNSFVPALREPPPQVVEVESWRDLPSAPIVPPMPHSGHVDRAKGFSIATGPLAASTSLVVLLIGITCLWRAAAICGGLAVSPGRLLAGVAGGIRRPCICIARWRAGAAYAAGLGLSSTRAIRTFQAVWTA